MKVVRYLILAPCLAIVGWQGVQCLIKFLDRPLATRLTSLKARGLMYPSVTLCPFEETETYNATVLANCQIEKNDYLEDGKWSSENCPDPQELHEKLVAKVEDYVIVVTILTYNQSGNQQDLIYPSDADFWTPLNSRQYGRCFSLNPPENILREGNTSFNARQTLLRPIGRKF